MIKPNWNIFESKFPDYERTFEWFVTLLFCREFNVKTSLEGYFNQAAIEKNPIPNPKGNGSIGFQAKYYKDSLSKHTSKILESIDNTKKYYPSVNKYYFYTNAEWGQSRGKTPKGKVVIETYAKQLGIDIEWRTTESFFKQEFVCIKNEDISEYFFTLDNSFLGNLKCFYEHTKQLFINIDYKIQKDDKVIQIDHSKELNELNEISKDAVVIHGEGGCGKSALIKHFMDEKPKFVFLGIKAIELSNCTDIVEVFHNCLPEKLSSFLGLYENKYFIIDSAEKILDLTEDNVFFQLITYLKTNNWKIIFTTRDNYFEALLNELIYTLCLSVHTINIAVEGEKELRQLLISNSIRMPTDSKFIKLICNPFYLKYYIQFYSDELQSSDYNSFKTSLWNSLTSVSRDFIEISEQRARTGVFYIDVKNVSSTIIEKLLDKKLITKDGDKYFISHDIFEEWALEKYMDSLFSEISSFYDFLKKMGTSFPIRRSYRLWLANKLGDNNSIVINQTIDYIKENLNDLYKIQDTIIAILLADTANIFFENLDTKLLENNCSLLKDIQKILRLTCKALDEELINLFNLDHSLYTLASFFTCPKGSGWNCFIDYVYKKKNVIGIDKLPIFFPLFKDWINKNKQGVTTRQAALMVLEFYNWEQEQEEHWRYSKIEKDIFIILSNSAKEIKLELSNLFDEVLKNKWKEHGDKYSSFIWEILKDIKYSTILGVLPNKVLELADFYWTKQIQPNINSFVTFRTHLEIEEEYSVEGHFKTDSFPASALHTPISMLLLIDYNKTIDFIISFFNKCTENYININQNGIKEVFLSIEGKQIKQYSSNPFWTMFRGTVGTTPYLLQCILMALEDYFINNLKKESITEIKEKLIYILKNSKTVALSAVVCSVVLFRYKELYSIGKILISVRDFIEMDFIRAFHEYEAKSLYEIGAYGHSLKYAKERIETCKQEFRKNSLQEIAYMYQFKLFESEQEIQVKQRQTEIYALLDKYYSELPPEEEQSDDDKNWRFRLASMDGRKRDIKSISIDGKDYVAFYPVIDEKLQKYKQIKDKQIYEDMPHLSLSNWINYEWKKDKRAEQSEYSSNPSLVIEEIKELEKKLKLHRPIKKEVFSPLDENTFWILNHNIFPKATACLIRDYKDSLSIEDLNYCKEIILSFASLPFNKNYSYQLGDGTIECISVVPNLLSLDCLSQDFNLINQILMMNLLIVSSGDKEYKEFLLSSIKENFSIEEILLFMETYLYLISDWNDYCFQIRDLLYREPENDNYIDVFIKNHSEVFNNYLSETFKGFSEIDFGKLSMDAIANILFLIREDVFSNKSFIKKITERSFYLLQENEVSHDKDFRNSYFLIENLTKILLLVPESDIKEYLEVFINNLSNQNFYEDLLKYFIYAEDELKKLDSFWIIWNQFYPRIVEIFNSPSSKKNSKILQAYLFNSVQWNEKAKDWHSFNSDGKAFFKKIGESLKSYESVIEYFSYIFYGAGSKYLNDGITWLAIIAKNCTNNTNENSNTYYLEQITKKYIYENLSVIRTNGIRKREIINILDYLIKKQSVLGYMLKDNIL
ncbi:MAG: ATP-binding protein [Treponema sp.]|nr:ATP-binding protein [Treponema sp.]